MPEPVELVVRLYPSDEVLQLREHVKTLQGQLDDLQARYNRLEYLYRCETLVNSELLDACKAHGVPVRPLLSQRAPAPPSL